MMALEQLAPATVAERGGSFAVEPTMSVKSNGREHAVRLFLLPAAGIPDVLQEPFDLCADQRGRLAEGEMAGSRDLHDAGAWDARGHVAGDLERDDRVLRSVEDQARDANRRQHVPDVDFPVHPVERLERSRGWTPNRR